jgi:uncharacterized cupin superfamily protein
MSAPAVAFAAPADVELAPNPINPAWIIEGNPQARAKGLAESADGASSIMAWSCTPGRFEWHYAVDETVHIISGEVLVTDENGKIHRLGPGDMAFFPAGSHSVWQVTKTVRKLAVCRHSMPRPFGFVLRAWNKLFHRLTGFPTGGGLGEGPCQAPAVGKSPRRRPCARKSTGAYAGFIVRCSSNSGKERRSN